MNLEGRTLNKIRAHPIGEAAITMARNAIRSARQIRYPAISPDEQITTFTYRGEEITLRHRRTPADRSVVRQCFRYEEYNVTNGAHAELLKRRYEADLAAGLVPLIVDCGAHIGASVRWFANRYPEAHIVAIEPAPDNFLLLQQNTAGIDVDLRQTGIAAKDGSAFLCDLGDGAWGYRTHETPTGAPVEMISIRTLMASKPASKYAPFILKMDIEGGEANLFTASAPNFDSFPLIVLEPHDWMLPGQRSSVDFFRFHSSAGREFCMKGENIASISWESSLRP